MSRGGISKSGTWHYHLLAMWSWARDLTSQCLSLPSCKWVQRENLAVGCLENPMRGRPEEAQSSRREWGCSQTRQRHYAHPIGVGSDPGVSPCPLTQLFDQQSPGFVPACPPLCLPPLQVDTREPRAALELGWPGRHSGATPRLPKPVQPAGLAVCGRLPQKTAGPCSASPQTRG